MRIVPVVLLTGIALLQWPLWFGKGSWVRSLQLESQLTEQRALNEKLLSRNMVLAADVQDLKTGHAAVEERARNELGMVRQGEVFFQILGPVAR
ncbi:cell division protein FtsB [Laribacter hongkongensis]|uniref:cell division protein FtsB n=1 Tax=Laribacter hongkongensis TaxID=168471 RepID=UPI001EFCB6F7|nr:cell division protein FtsB [Laribacter hongkongensis]MCG9093974.1 cell division protein FtsB [Laribacter hongkongensis]